MRATALAAVERSGGLDDRQTAAGLADPDPAVRVRTLELAAARAATPSDGWLLVPLFDDPEPAVVEVAAWACGECLPATSGTVPRLASLATGHADPLVREAAVAALGAIGDPAGLPAVLEGCRDKPAIRRRAVLALAPFEGPDVEAALHAARTDRDWQVRQAAEDLLDDPADGGTAT